MKTFHCIYILVFKIQILQGASNNHVEPLVPEILYNECQDKPF